MYHATNGTDEARVRVYHWWPGKPYCNGMPSYLVNEAKRRGSRYLSMVATDLPGATVSATAFCCPKDSPSRTMGRTIALGRLGKALEGEGWRVKP